MFGMATTSIAQQNADSLKKANLVQLDSTLFKSRAPIMLERDTIFMLYEWVQGYNPATRAKLATEKIEALVRQGNFEPDSFHLVKKGDYYHINYQTDFIVNIGSIDADWTGLNFDKASEECLNSLRAACTESNWAQNLKNLLIQIALAILVIIVFVFIIKYINKLFRFFATKIVGLKGSYLKGIKFGSYEFIGESRLTNIALIANNILRIAFLLFILYLTLPILFSIFPWTKGIATTLFAYVANPIKSVFISILDFLPSLFKILVIFFAFRYVIKGFKFLSVEVANGKLVIPNFYPDWAQPTSRIVSFILYVFMFVLIWPSLPGSDSQAFKGVSVFLGILISLGSSTSIANIMAGLVITYMRPFRVGDRVKVGDVSGDIMEKNLLVV